tara:strand:- start:1012 stop:1245 length:234 start_codon:yes stop_codon:yes gene_type:complete
MDFGAVGDGVSDDTAAVRDAIQNCTLDEGTLKLFYFAKSRSSCTLTCTIHGLVEILRIAASDKSDFVSDNSQRDQFL